MKTLKYFGLCNFIAFGVILICFSACKKSNQDTEPKQAINDCTAKWYFHNGFPRPTYTLNRNSDSLITLIKVSTGRNYDAGTSSYFSYLKTGKQISQIDIHYVDKTRGAYYIEDSTITDYTFEFDANELLKKVWIKTKTDTQKRLLTEYEYLNSKLKICKIYDETGKYSIRNYTYQQTELKGWTQGVSESSNYVCEFEFYTGQPVPSTYLLAHEFHLLGITLPRYTNVSYILPTATKQAIFGNEMLKRIIQYQDTGNSVINFMYEFDENRNIKKQSFDNQGFSQNNVPPFPVSFSIESNIFYYYDCK